MSDIPRNTKERKKDTRRDTEEYEGPRLKMALEYMISGLWTPYAWGCELERQKYGRAVKS